jgi:hypothetical protein
MRCYEDECRGAAFDAVFTKPENSQPRIKVTDRNFESDQIRSEENRRSGQNSEFENVRHTDSGPLAEGFDTTIFHTRMPPCVCLSREIKCYENMGDRRTD